jgi:hypothetical protein
LRRHVGCDFGRDLGCDVCLSVGPDVRRVHGNDLRRYRDATSAAASAVTIVPARGTTFATTFPSYLVAGFHTRFGPPAPFSTTLTVCPSPNPVTYFSHSHPGGLVFPVPSCASVGTGPKARASRREGVDTRARGSRLSGYPNLPWQIAMSIRRSDGLGHWSGSGSPGRALS